MADWKKLAKMAILADKKIDTKEVNMIREVIFEDNIIDKAEVEFIRELRNEADYYLQAFNQLFIDTVKAYLLEKETISDEKVLWLRQMIFEDNDVDITEKKLLKLLQQEAKELPDSFHALLAEVEQF